MTRSLLLACAISVFGPPTAYLREIEVIKSYSKETGDRIIFSDEIMPIIHAEEQIICSSASN